MTRYIKWDDVANRYPTVKDLGDAEELKEGFIQYAEAEIDARLGRFYAMPITAGSSYPMIRDLSIDLSYIRTRNITMERANLIKDHIDDRINGLINGKSALIDDSGAVLDRVSDTMWGSHTEFQPTFGMHDTLDQEVDTDLKEDEVDRRD